MVKIIIIYFTEIQMPESHKSQNFSKVGSRRLDSRVIPELIKNIHDSFPESIIIDQIYHLKHV